MSDLPSPYSIIIGTIISLYSDINSPIYSSCSSSIWSLKLSRLIQQSVQREEGGLFSSSAALRCDCPCDETNNPASDANDDEKPIVDNFLDGDWMARLDGFLDDLFLGRSGSGILDSNKICAPGSNNSNSIHNINASSAMKTGRSLLRPWTSQSAAASLRIHPTLSSLLDSIDDAFYHCSSNNRIISRPKLSNNGNKRRRSPPSIALLSKLQSSSKSIDALINLVDEWHALLDGCHHHNSNNNNTEIVVSVDAESTFGIHLRKLCLGMEEIPFESMSRLWLALRREISLEVMAQQVDDEEEVLAARGPIIDWLPSSPQIERLLRRTCLHPNLVSYILHYKQCHSNAASQRNEGEGRKKKNNNHHADDDDDTIRLTTTIIHQLQQTHPECPSISFFLFLLSLIKGQRCQALESLHRYFDYAMIHERKERAERAVMLQLGGGAAAAGSNGGGGNNNNVDAMTMMRTTGIGGITTIASGMGGITGGMTGGVMNGVVASATTGGGGRGVGGSGNNSNTNNSSDAKIYKESNVMEYAAILLAQMHSRFGFTRLSIQAAEEAVRVAQQSGDDECVSFANAWLAVTSSSIGVGGKRRGGLVKKSIHAMVGGLSSEGYDERQLSSRSYRPLIAPSISSSVVGRSTLEEEGMLQHCHARAIQRGLTALSVGTSLELARRTVYQRGDAAGQLLTWSNESSSEGFDSSSSLAWDGIQRSGTGSLPSSFVDNRSGGSGGGGLLFNRPGGGAEIHTDVRNMTASEAIGILGRQALAESGLWDSTGHSSLASLASSRALYGFRSNDAFRRVLSSLLLGPGNSEGGNEGGVYVTTLERIASMSDKAAVPTPECILSTSALFHEWATRSYDISVARNLQCLMANHVAFPFNSLPPVETSLLLLTKSTHLFLQQEDYERAKATARQACWLSSRHALFFHQGWQLLQLALIDLEASTSSSSNFESSLSPLLECLHLSEQYAMDPLRATALLCLSRVFLCMGRICKARALLNASIPLLMQHGHVWFQAEACLTLAKCHLAEFSSEEICTTSKLQLQENSLAQLEKAASLFKKIDDIHRLKQVYYLQARVHQCRPGDQRKRDEAAKNFFRFNTMKQLKLTGRKQWDKMHVILISNLNEISKCC